MIREMPTSGDLPEVDPHVDTCSECGDFVTWCPVWRRRFPELERLRNG